MSKSNIYQFGFKLVGPGPNGPAEMMLESGDTKRLNDFLFDLQHWAIPGKLTPRLVDLLRIATAVYVSDRLCRRDRTHAGYGWCRSMSLRIPVFDVDFWTRSEVTDCLHRGLKFLSEDYWEIEPCQFAALLGPGPACFPFGLEAPCRGSDRLSL